MLRIRAMLISLILFTSAVTGFAAETIDINSADPAAIAEAMTGIGLKRAEAIVAFRKENGPFKTVDDLVFVKGIGSATVDKNRERLTVD